MDRFTVTDGTDTATLTGDPEHPDVELRRWSVELDIAADGTDTGSSDERTCRMLEAATQAVSMQGGGRLEYWLQEVGPQSDKVPTTAGFTRFRDLPISGASCRRCRQTWQPVRSPPRTPQPSWP